MKLKTIGCIVVGVLIIGFYIVIGYGPKLGLVTPVNHTQSLPDPQTDFVDNNSVIDKPIVVPTAFNDNNSYITWSG